MVFRAILVVAMAGLLGCSHGRPVTPSGGSGARNPPGGAPNARRPADGPIVKYWDAGRKLKHFAGRYLGGVRDSTWTWWYRTGKKRMLATYVRGRYHGPVRHWHPSGRLRLKGQYRVDQKVGVWTEYSADGARVKTCHHDSGSVSRCKTVIRFKPDTIDSNCHPIPRARPRSRPHR